MNSASRWDWYSLQIDIRWDAYFIWIILQIRLRPLRTLENDAQAQINQQLWTLSAVWVRDATASFESNTGWKDRIYVTKLATDVYSYYQCLWLKDWITSRPVIKLSNLLVKAVVQGRGHTRCDPHMSGADVLPTRMPCDTNKCKILRDRSPHSRSL